ncbi:MAG: hypothetical protein IRZ24_06305 [Thermogemmatispora sp.]|uniref:hypothetical protein n=1 Tax=Thermogemmatispora sp. TaxID=1968838 RepID=UPI001DB8E885|nr:hypothetical protein [Thermogemmatispora sp.]MBX5449663.1 hypothetical protein [Thermogemmatispora sp.]
MIARTLSQWLARLFAWWPGRKRRSQPVEAEASGVSSAHALVPPQPPLPDTPTSTSPATPTSTSPATPASGLASQAGPASRYSFLLESQDIFLPPRLTAPPGVPGGLPFLDQGPNGLPSPLADPNLSLSERIRWMRENDLLSSGEAATDAEADEGTAVSETSDSSPAALLQQRRLEFLRYLVRRGLVNEGFEQEDLPEQYRRLL